jgi:hypothetical protein
MSTVRTISRVAAVAGTIVVVTAALAACASGTTPSAIASALANASLPPLPSETATPEPTSTPVSEAPSESVFPSAVATDIDPCDLITSEEASALVGVKFGAGKESTTEDNLKICAYSAPGPNIFNVDLAIAPDEATAKAAEKTQEQDLQSQADDMADLGLTVTKLPNFAPNTDAAIIQGAKSAGGLSIAGRGILVLRGTTFFGFNDIATGGGQPPSEQAMKDKAMELLDRVP